MHIRVHLLFKGHELVEDLGFDLLWIIWKRKIEVEREDLEVFATLIKLTPPANQPQQQQQG